MSSLQTLVLNLVFVFLYLVFCTCTDTITSTQFIRNPETLLSSGKNFKLGFFSPVNTTNLYVGIYYNMPLVTPLWVANRDKPINDSSGIFTISGDGNLVVLNGKNEIMWSTNVSDFKGNSSAQLLDTGNLVLKDLSTGRILWQSFEHPSDSYLQKMRLGAKVGTDEKYVMTAWKSPSDPSTGSFSAGVDPLNIAQVFVWNGSDPYWRSGPWNGQFFIGIPNLEKAYNNGFNFVDDKEGSAYLTFTYANESIITYFSLNSEGTLAQMYWNEGKQNWQVRWSAPRNDCEHYGKCGPFGSCYLSNSPICTCLKGFEPKIPEEWNRGNWTSGCVRRLPLQCDRNNTEGKEDGFFKLTNMKVPDFGSWSNAPEGECGSQCFHNCSCIAYAYHAGIGCMQWSHILVDIEKFSNRTGATLYVRVAYSELGKKQQRKRYLLKRGDAYTEYSNEGMSTETPASKSCKTTRLLCRGRRKSAGLRIHAKWKLEYVSLCGYMAPEYAMGGRFSEKSDVFSFGVLLLEIVSGKKNTCFYQDEHSFSLLGYAWKLWNEEKILELMDPRISDPCLLPEIWRYIHVGLLCVQDFPEDRPTVSTVLSMLSSEIADLPTPKQPALTVRQISKETSQNTCSVNNITATIVEGR
ncbi:hypothetical protein RJ640_017569 [Escallonia rubra]|uniref:non-specific serine/threonine protein kinase n=1 Tax=Escallonia rubra TaxID=112253 RepID=A0AA88RWS5_9ASTE|nr:hypothetical protein RJ640_017569 [Escallonia rubra]